jgi:hypothetical protein
MSFFATLSFRFCVKGKLFRRNARVNNAERPFPTYSDGPPSVGYFPNSTTRLSRKFVNIAVSADKGPRTGNELLKFIITKFAEQHFAAFRTTRTVECFTFFKAHWHSISQMVDK